MSVEDVSREPVHPPDLAVADTEYIVPWGRAPAGRVLGAASLLLAGIAVLTPMHSLYWGLAAVPVVALAAFLVLFFRNPRREVPGESGVLVAPADGTVQDIEFVDEPEFVGERCVRIGIFLSIFNVHVNRAPAAGRVVFLRHRDGVYHDARNPRAAAENEANAIGIVRDDAGGPPGARLLVKQISGAIARRIVCPLAEGALVARGGLIGMIKYGSRTELYIPAAAGAEVLVRRGDRVKGGATVLAAWRSAAAAPGG